MKQYMLSVHDDSATAPALSEDDIQAMYADVDALNKELQASGAWVFGGGLHPPASATVVRVENGKTLTTDGPYSESKEQLGGFWVLQFEDLDAALRMAERAAVACRGAIEVRPFQDEPGAE